MGQGTEYNHNIYWSIQHKNNNLNACCLWLSYIDNQIIDTDKKN